MDAGGVAPVALIVHAAAEEETVGDVEAGEVGAHAGTGLALMVLVHQNGTEHAGGALFGKVLADGLQRVAFVEDVVDDQDSAAARILDGRARQSSSLPP